MKKKKNKRPQMRHKPQLKFPSIVLVNPDGTMKVSEFCYLPTELPHRRHQINDIIGEEINPEKLNKTGQVFEISWNDIKKYSNCPPPYSVKAGSKIFLLVLPNNIMIALGFAHFTKKHRWLLKREQSNHINLFEFVVFLLSIIWNVARVPATMFYYKDMKSLETYSRISSTPINIGETYKFYLKIEKLKTIGEVEFGIATLIITDLKGKDVLAIAWTKVAIKK